MHGLSQTQHSRELGKEYSSAPQRFSDLLTADSAAGGAAARELSADCCADIAQIEAQLLAVYNDAKASALDDALEECASGSPVAGQSLKLAWLDDLRACSIAVMPTLQHSETFGADTHVLTRLAWPGQHTEWL